MPEHVACLAPVLFAQGNLAEAKAAQPIYGEWSYMAWVIEHGLLLRYNELQAAWRDDLLAWRRGVSLCLDCGGASALTIRGIL